MQSEHSTTELLPPNICRTYTIYIWRHFHLKKKFNTFGPNQDKIYLSLKKIDTVNTEDTLIRNRRGIELQGVSFG